MKGKRKVPKQQHTPRPEIKLTASTKYHVKLYPTEVNRQAAHALVLGHLRAAYRALGNLETCIDNLPDPLDTRLPDDAERAVRNHAELDLPQWAAELSEHVTKLCSHLGDWLGADAQD